MTAKEYLKSKNIKEICNIYSGKGTNGYFITPEQMEEFAKLKVKNNVSLDCVSLSVCKYCKSTNVKTEDNYKWCVDCDMEQPEK